MSDLLHQQVESGCVYGCKKESQKVKCPSDLLICKSTAIHSVIWMDACTGQAGPRSVQEAAEDFLTFFSVSLL